MPKTVLTLSQTVVRQETCERCGAHYEYDHEVEEKATVDDQPDGEARARARAEAALLRALEEDRRIVPCPRCKALTRKMRKDHLMIPVFLTGWIVLCLAVAFGVLWLVAASGALFWVIGLLALGGAAIGALALLLWPFGVYKNRIGRLVGGA